MAPWVEVPGDKIKTQKIEFGAFIGPSGQNQLYHTPLLLKIWDLTKNKKIVNKKIFRPAFPTRRSKTKEAGWTPPLPIGSKSMQGVFQTNFIFKQPAISPTHQLRQADNEDIDFRNKVSQPKNNEWDGSQTFPGFVLKSLGTEWKSG